MAEGIAIEIKRLHAILDSLTVDEQARVWIDRKRRLPHRIRITTVMNYRVQGAPRSETAEVDFQFKEFN